MKPALSIALTTNDRTRPVLDGRVKAEGIDLMPTALFPSEMFWRQLKFAEFDISEMSVSSLTIMTSHAPTDWVAIPVFTTRVFFHTDMIVRSESGITKPEDLRGKRLGVPEYQQTRAVWVRGALKHEFGVDASEIQWFMERPPEKSHGGSTGFSAPPGIDLTYVDPATDLGSMLLAGELDAAVHHFSEKNLVDRAIVDLRSSSKVRYLFAQREAEAHRYFAKTQLYPINHCVVIRRSLVERYPWLPLNLFTAFASAKQLDTAQRLSSLGPSFATGAVSREAAAIDPLLYGVKTNERVLNTLMDYLHEQHLVTRRVALDEIFHPSTLDL